MKKVLKIISIITWVVALVFLIIYVGNASTEMFTGLKNIINGMLVKNGKTSVTADSIIDNAVLFISLVSMIASFTLTMITYHLYSVENTAAKNSLKHIKVTHGSKTLSMKELNKQKKKQEKKAAKEAKEHERAKKKAEIALKKAEEAKKKADATAIEAEIEKIEADAAEQDVALTAEALAAKVSEAKRQNSVQNNTTAAKQTTSNVNDYLNKLNGR